MACQAVKELTGQGVKMVDTAPAARLDPTSYVPLYMQLAGLIRADIRAGVLREEDQLPSEPGLMRDYGVSRSTAIAALDNLVAAHEAYRVKGKGTFVARRLLGRFSLSTSLSEDLRARGLEPSSVVLAFDGEAPDVDIRERLGADADSEYLRLVRLRMADGEPVAIQTAYLPAELYPGLSRDAFENGSLYSVMRNRYAINPTWAEAVVEARRVQKDEVPLLGVAKSDSVLVVWHLSFDEALRTLEYVRSVYRADRFSFASGRQLITQPEKTQATHRVPGTDSPSGSGGPS